jgi:SET domain-containing protein
MNDNFIIKKSQIPGAGKGLYTKKEIKKGERFLEYTGEIITEKELNRRAENDLFGYAFYISKRKCIDAYNMPEVIGRYANDAKGLTRVEGLKNNCYYDVWKNRAWLVAGRNIKAGEELLISYGAEYWRDIKYNIKLEEERLERIKKAKAKKVKT